MYKMLKIFHQRLRPKDKVLWKRISTDLYNYTFNFHWACDKKHDILNPLHFDTNTLMCFTKANTASSAHNWGMNITMSSDSHLTNLSYAAKCTWQFTTLLADLKWYMETEGTAAPVSKQTSIIMEDIMRTSMLCCLCVSMLYENKKASVIQVAGRQEFSAT